MTPEYQEKYCEKCEHCQMASLHFYGKTFLACFGGEYKGKWVAEIDECPLDLIGAQRE